MSVYLGQDKVGITNIIDSTQKLKIQETLPSTSWARPNEWPDLDSLNLQMSGEDSFIYMTFYTGQPDSILSFHFDHVTKNNTATLDIGTISNGTFTVETTQTINDNSNNYIYLDDNAGYSAGYKVIRLIGKIKRFYLISCTKTEGGTIYYKLQPILERIAYLPTLTTFVSSSTNHCWGTYTLQREKLANDTGTSLTSTANMYNACYSLQSLDIDGLRTPNVTDMSGMFSGCEKLRSIDVSNFNTAKVTSFASIFYQNYNLTSLDLSNFNTEKLTNMSQMFYYCRQLTFIVGLENFNTSNVTNMTGIFNNCYSLQSVDNIINWNTSKVTSISSLFCHCRNLKFIDLSNWNVSLVTTLANTFECCYSLKTIIFPSTKTSANLTSLSVTFSNCQSLQYIDCSWIDCSGGNLGNLYSTFANCWYIKELHIPIDWDVTNVKGTNAANNTFANCYALKSITGISNWNFASNAVGLNAMFSGCRALETIDVSNWQFPSITTLASTFANCWSLKSIDLSKWEIPSTCTSLVSMFDYCFSLTNIGDISKWDVSHITSMATMFRECHSLLELPNIKDWDMSAVTSISSMFYGCYNIREIDLSGWDLSSCVNMSTCFRYCYNLEKINLSNWTIPTQTTAPGQFLADCWNLKKIINPLAFTLNHSYNSDWSLEYQIILNILNGLPQTSTARTLNLSTQNINRLTAAEKAIATGKGWTLAN